MKITSENLIYGLSEVQIKFEKFSQYACRIFCLPVLRPSKNAPYKHRYLLYDVAPARSIVREPTRIAFDV